MYLRKIEIKNFRLLKDVSLFLEENATVIVGRNNSGKTSLAEFFRRLFSDNAASFKFEDFHLSAHDRFWDAFTLKQGGSEEEAIRKVLPMIESRLTLAYDQITSNLSDFIIELDPDCKEVVIVVRYQLANGKIDTLFNNINLASEKTEDDKKTKFFRVIKDRIPHYFRPIIISESPNDPTNQKSLDPAKLRALIQSGFINAQRGLDDVTSREQDVLGKILGILFSTAMSDSAHPNDRDTARMLEDMVEQMQKDININFANQLKRLLPAFSLFGYPGLPDPKLRTETQLDVQDLLDNNTKIRYSGVYGIHLPETYNGLGTRNLIFILLKLLEFFKTFSATQPLPGICLVFIEEPEAHLHPQMQEVFIAKLGEIAVEFFKGFGGAAWPVQFVVTTHSSHIANRASFESMRYFLAVIDPTRDGVCQTKIKDLKMGFSDTPNDDKNFLYQYMTLTRCDLLFADKAILIEGTSERLLLPRMIEKVDSTLANPSRKLSSQYISVLEVGGAYAHIFFRLLDFLELRTLIITDLDSVNHNDGGRACRVSEGTGTSNTCIKTWFEDPNITPISLLARTPMEKTRNLRCLAYQIPEDASKTSPCGRSLEDAFMLANPDLFKIREATPEQNEMASWDKAQRIKKSEFALKHAISVTEWVVPRYIKEGLIWLTEEPKPIFSDESKSSTHASINAETEIKPESSHD